jgi:hypothetical protein
MILYNITVIIDEAIHDEWLQWVDSRYIPGIMDSGMFVSSRLLKVIDSPNEGVTYCMQFIADSVDQYNAYKEKFADPLISEHDRKFEGSLVSFTTLMEFKETR